MLITLKRNNEMRQILLDVLSDSPIITQELSARISDLLAKLERAAYTERP